MDIRHIATGTVVNFICPDDNWKKVADIQYWNKRTEGCSGELGDVEFNQDNKNAVDQFLNSVFETGWSSKDIYLFGKHYKSIVFDQPNLKGNKFTYWSSNYGCLALILFPIFIVIELFIKIGILGRIEQIEIESIRKTTTLEQ